MRLLESRDFPWGTLIATHAGWAYVPRGSGALALEADPDAPHVRELERERVDARHGPPRERVLAEVLTPQGQALLLSDGRVRIGRAIVEPWDGLGTSTALEVADAVASRALSEGARETTRPLVRWLLVAIDRRGRLRGDQDRVEWVADLRVVWTPPGRYEVPGLSGTVGLDAAVDLIVSGALASRGGEGSSA